MPTELEPRKQPQQERSRRMRARILEASLRVLRDEGPLGFTTTRVADAAGISVGSLYQYFPNKHALVMALHAADVREGWEHIQAILGQEAWSPRHKLDELVLWFFSTEAEEVAAVRVGRRPGGLPRRRRRRDADLYAAAAARFAEFIDESSDTLRGPRRSDGSRPRS